MTTVAPSPLSAGEVAQIEGLVNEYTEERRDTLRALLGNLESQIRAWKPLPEQIHSLKWRVKDPAHLRDKLIRRLERAKGTGKEFGITKENLFEQITDLAGMRLLHLHTEQMGKIDGPLKAVFEEYRYRLVEGPFARTWDDESRRYFEGIGIEVRKSPLSLYTSVHYVIEFSSRTKYTCEIQVRTLAEELFGEVDHRINYPIRTTIVSCREQLLVLARVTSSCSRLVDSIFRSLAEEQERAKREAPLWKRAIARLKEMDLW